MKPTEKLYYIDAYIKEFDSYVLSCEKCEKGYDIVLEKTAFFPGEGGQYSDTGRIENAEVTEVILVDNIIHHYAESAVNVNECVHCAINFEERFDKMQQHTAEHIISGFFHKLYGVENTGFHLGSTDVTLDTSRPVTKEEILTVEKLVNEAVCKNVKIETFFPKPNELSTLEYRSKLDLTENVRIVNIGEYDSCACCAPHVAYTGEIGFVKIVDAVKHKGGSRIRMLAGSRAYDYIAKIAKEASAISVMLSAPITDISSETEKLLLSKSALEYKLSEMGKATAALLAETLSETNENKVVFYPMLDMDSLRVFINKASEKVKGTLVGLVGEEGSYKYILHSESPDFQKIVKDANTALSGRGGGRALMASGTFCANLSQIEEYFKTQK